MDRWHLVELPGEKQPWQAVYGDPIHGKRGVEFPTQGDAEDFINAANLGHKLQSSIPFHVDECCGCTDVYQSRHGIILLCNECGEKRILMTDETGSIAIGMTLPFPCGVTHV